MPATENGLVTQPRRGRAITVRTPGRHTFADAGNRNPILDDPLTEPAEDDLLELDGVEDEAEEGEAAPQHDDSEELEMWMRQTRRAHLLTPGQEEELAKRVQAKDLVESGKKAFAGFELPLQIDFRTLLQILLRDASKPFGKDRDIVPLDPALR